MCHRTNGLYEQLVVGAMDTILYEFTIDID